MSKSTKTWLIIATFFVVIGGLIFMGLMQSVKWDFSKLSTVKYETNSYEIQEEYKNISIVTDTSDVEFVISENAKSTVVCYEQTKMKHLVSVKEHTLTIEIQDTRKWYEHIGISFGSPKITVCLPKKEYGELSVRCDTGDISVNEQFAFERIDILGSTGDVINRASASEDIKLKTSTGRICVENVSANNIDLAVSTGDVSLKKVTCQSLVSKGSTGNILLEGVIAKESISVERNTGNVKLEGSDAVDIQIKTSTGDVKGTLLSEKVYIVETSTGDIKVPKTTKGGTCEIKTSTGDIKISVQ